MLMLLAARTGAARLVGLEIQPILAEMAARNLALNQLANRAEVIEGDLRLPRLLSPERFELVVANPPYIPAKTGIESPSGPLAQAKHELSCTLREVAEAAARWTAPPRPVCHGAPAGASPRDPGRVGAGEAGTQVAGPGASGPRQGGRRRPGRGQSRGETGTDGSAAVVHPGWGGVYPPDGGDLRRPLAGRAVNGDNSSWHL